MEGHTVSQAPTVTGCAVLTGSEKSQVATIAIQVFMILCCEVYSGLIRSWVDGENGLTYPLSHLP